MKVKTEKVVTTIVTIELDLESAQILRNVLESVGGSPNGPRKSIDAIADALNEKKITSHPDCETSHAVYIEWNKSKQSSNAN